MALLVDLVFIVEHTAAIGDGETPERKRTRTRTHTYAHAPPHAHAHTRTRAHAHAHAHAHKHKHKHTHTHTGARVRARAHTRPTFVYVIGHTIVSICHHITSSVTLFALTVSLSCAGFDESIDSCVSDSECHQRNVVCYRHFADCQRGMCMCRQPYSFRFVGRDMICVQSKAYTRTLARM